MVFNRKTKRCRGDFNRLRAGYLYVLLNKQERNEFKMEEKKEEVEKTTNNDEKQKLEREENNKNQNLENVAKDMAKQELEEMTDRYKRLMAEFDNFKKRSAKERESLYDSLTSDIVTSILPVLDNLEKAVSTKTEDQNYKQGVEMVYKQFMDTLASLGVEEIKTVGETFNPEYHEAVSSVQDENLGEKEIKEEFRKGYKIREKVIRHSMVVVAN